MKLARPKRNSSPDFIFIAFLAVLVVFGLVMLTSASSDLAKRDFNDSTYYLVHQLENGLSLGLIGFFIGYFVYYRMWEKYSLILLAGAIILLLAVFTSLGLTEKGGNRWIDLGFFSFQPGEFLKLAFFTYLAAWISKGQERGKSFWGGLFPFAILLGIVGLLLILQPATTTAGLIFLTSLIIYFTSGARIKFIAVLLLIASIGLVGLISLKDGYRGDRLRTFMNQKSDLQGKGYQVDQAKTAIGSGGLWGVGFGKSTTKLHYLPEPIGDSIFAVIAEELGFIGTTTFLLFFLAFVWRGLKIARAAPDMFGRLLVTSFISVIGLQAFVNIAAISGIIPMTGVPLPFISYGGTALAVFLTMGGIIANISKYRR
ncbi:MAG: putative peptidoglycan glycosyltransferase FtsW [Candidatus Paceibacterota bacterium]|jgi:cell division protein FtsW